MDVCESFSSRFPKSASGFYFVIGLMLVCAPHLMGTDKVKSVIAMEAMVLLSAGLASVCNVMGLAKLKLINEPSWAWDDLVMPPATVLALSWLFLI